MNLLNNTRTTFLRPLQRSGLSIVANPLLTPTSAVSSKKPLEEYTRTLSISSKNFSTLSIPSHVSIKPKPLLQKNPEKFLEKHAALISALKKLTPSMWNKDEHRYVNILPSQQKSLPSYIGPHLSQRILHIQVNPDGTVTDTIKQNSNLVRTPISSLPKDDQTKLLDLINELNPKKNHFIDVLINFKTIYLDDEISEISTGWHQDFADTILICPIDSTNIKEKTVIQIQDNPPLFKSHSGPKLSFFKKDLKHEVLLERQTPNQPAKRSCLIIRINFLDS